MKALVHEKERAIEHRKRDYSYREVLAEIPRPFGLKKPRRFFQNSIPNPYFILELRCIGQREQSELHSGAL